jgi:hypothetical protein
MSVSVARTFSSVIRGAVITATPAQAAELERSGRVADIEPDLPVTASITEEPVPWGLDRIDQRNLPLSGTYTPAAAGAGVTAYVVDSGILASHADFAGRVVDGWTAVNDGWGTDDCNGHGTYVAGSLAGSTHGVATAVTIVPIRVLDCDAAGYASDVIAGLDWVASHHQQGFPAVVNLSLGGDVSPILDAAIQGIINDGVTAVVAAGNVADDACNTSPARVPAALTVAASDSWDQEAGFSNYGACIDLFAPGVDIRSTWNTSTTATETASGTSAASPHVAGAAALLLGQYPALTPGDVAAAILARTTTGVITAISEGTPNRLLYTAATGTPDPAPVVSAPPAIASAADVVAAGSDGVLWAYPANGKGGFQPRKKIGAGWSGLIKGFVTDWNQDGVFDLIAQWKDGRLSFYPGKTGGGFGTARTIGFSGWNSYQVLVGHWSIDNRYPGIVATDSAGTLWHYGTNNGASLIARDKIGTGWKGLYLTMTDFDQDGRQDILAKRSDGGLVLYRSTGHGRFFPEIRRQVGSGWSGINSITSVAGFKGFGSNGLISRLTDGRLAYYPFSRGTWGSRSILGSGWASYNIFR